MPIALNGSGTITGISAGGLPDGCVTGDDIANNTIPAAKLGTTEQGQLCKAWVNFNGTTLGIRASYNVSSITRVGTGAYTVNFTNAMTDANGCALCCFSNFSTGGSGATGFGIYGTTMTASSVSISDYATNGGTNNTAFYTYDATIVTAAIFR